MNDDIPFTAPGDILIDGIPVRTVNDTPERALLRAILIDAVKVVVDGKKTPQYRYDLEWFNEPPSYSARPFQFWWVCSHLGFEPTYVQHLLYRLIRSERARRNQRHRTKAA